MIISHNNKYVFVEMNHTASTAISEELCAKYGGQEILWKHARYRDFIKQATNEEKNYFYFTGKRNPLDIMVTLYFRHKLDPEGCFCNIQAPHVTVHNYKMYRYISRYQADFPVFFLKFFRWRIFYEWKGRDFKNLNYIYRFEQLQDGFIAALDKLGLTPIRPVPVVNSTAERSKDFTSYYTTEIQPWAYIILRDLMREWGYEFPSDWRTPTAWHWAYYHLFLKPMFYLRKVFHLFLDHPAVYWQLYVIETGWVYLLRRRYKMWREKTIG